MDSQLPKDSLLTRLRDLHAPVRVPGLGEYQYACGEAALQIEELQRDVARWKNAHQIAMIERDSFRQQAAMNRDTIKEMQHQRDTVHDELVHLQNAPRSFR